MALKGKTIQEQIWNYLKLKGLSNHGIAGLMGNLYAESGLRSDNLQDTFQKKFEMDDQSYTAAVDEGRYGNFVCDCAGYGLAQWTFWSRKEKLLNYARSRKCSIGDLEMQLDFLMLELKSNYGPVLAQLKSANSVRAASDVVLFDFEAPESQGKEVQEERAGYGQRYYDMFAAPASGGSLSGNGVLGRPDDSEPITSGIKVGDTVNYSGNVHYTSSYAAGKARKCMSGPAKVTAINQSGAHSYHLVAIPEKGATVHGWVDAADIQGAASGSGSSGGTTTIKVGDTVNYSGNVHYTSSYAAGKARKCMSGPAKVTAINQSGAHSYHLVAIPGKGATVHGWVDADMVLRCK